MPSSAPARGALRPTPTNGGRVPTDGTSRSAAPGVDRDNSHMHAPGPALRARSSCPARQPESAVRAAGFTLIELMVALVVAAILASLALPAFFDAVRKSRRSEAFAALSTLQQAQERYRANNAAYAGTLAALGLPVAAESTQYTTANGHYQVSIATADASSYTLRAVAAGGQAQDKACATMMLRMRAGTVQYGSACSTCTLSEPPTDPGRCWSRQ